MGAAVDLKEPSIRLSNELREELAAKYSGAGDHHWYKESLLHPYLPVEVVLVILEVVLRVLREYGRWRDFLTGRSGVL